MGADLVYSLLSARRQCPGRWVFNAPSKGIVNCQNTLDKGVPRMQQWPLDIPQWHITQHPQLSAKIIIAYYMRLSHIATLRANSQIIINSIYLSDIYEEIIHQFPHMYCVQTQTVVLPWGLETVDLQHIDSESFPSQDDTLTKCGFNVGQRVRHWFNFKTTLGQLGQFLVG